MQCPRSVMLWNKIDNALRQAHLFPQLRAVCDVADYDLRALGGFEMVVRIVARLVLDKMLGRGCFAYIMIKGADTRQKGIRTDSAAGFFGQLTDGMRMP